MDLLKAVRDEMVRNAVCAIEIPPGDLSRPFNRSRAAIGAATLGGTGLALGSTTGLAIFGTAISGAWVFAPLLFAVGLAAGLIPGGAPETQDTPAFKAYQARKTAWDVLSKAQQSHCKYQQELAERASTIVKYLVDHFSGMLHGLHHDSDARVEELANATGAQVSDLREWCTYCRKIDELSVQISDSKSAEKTANGKISQSSGFFGGAKSGLELEHKNAKAELANAVQKTVELDSKRKKMGQEATTIGAKILGQFVFATGKISSAAFSEEIRSFLKAEENAALEKLAQHQSEQKGHLEKIKSEIAALEVLYGAKG